MFGLYHPKTCRYVQHGRLLFRHRGFISLSRKMTESLWEEFFEDPSQFYDVRNIKKSQKWPDFRHKRSGKALWVDGFSNPPWVSEKLQKTELSSLDVSDDHVGIVQLIKSCAKKKDISTMRMLESEKAWITEDIPIASTLIRCYAKCGAMKEARKVFDKLTERHIVCWTALIAGYAEQGFGEEALTCFREMVNDGVSPNSVTYVCSLKACAIIGALDVVKEIHEHVKRQGLLNKHIVLGTTLVNAYAKCGVVEEARLVFDQLVERDVVSWSTLIAGYVEQGFGQEALECFKEMESDRVNPNSVTYASILKACAMVGALDTVKEIHAQVREKQLLKKSITLGNSLLNAYAKCGAMKEAQQVFDKLEERDVVSWSSLIDGYAEQGLGEEALTCFREMQSDRVKSDAVAYSCSLKACAIVGALDIVKEIHVQLRKEGLLKKDIVLGITLVNAYAKCGSVKEACEVSDEIAERNVESWNALLSGYAQLGMVDEMLELLNRMMAEGIFPDAVTFLVLLNGCSHEALLEEGERLFSMIGSCGLCPTPEHYTCMVDLFGRAGWFEKAKSFVLDYTQTLLAFLGSCQKWINVDLGRSAFENLLELDKKCVSAYVSMANIYGAAGLVKESDEI